MQADTTDEAEQAESTSQTPYADSKTPLQKIAGKIQGALRVKFDSWVTDFGGVLLDLGWGTWEDFEGYEYEDMEIDPHAQILVAEINEAVNAKKKPPSDLLMRRMQGVQVAKAVRAVAREHLGIPTPTKSPPRSHAIAQSQLSSKTESELHRETVKLSVFSHLKCEEKIELMNGASKPAHVSDTATYVGEVAKVFVGMEGYEALQQQIELRKLNPNMDAIKFTTNDDVPLDLWKQYSRLLYGGMPLQYRKEVLAKSQFKDELFEPGVMAFALFQVSLDISDLEASRKRYEYQQPTPVRPNDKPMMERAFAQYERDPFELLQLQELATAKTTAPDKQYEVGTILFSNYPDLAHRWSRMWESYDTQDMHAMRKMMQEMSELIKKLPDSAPHRPRAHSPAMPIPQQPRSTGGTQDKYMCKDFQRTGACNWEAKTGRKCRFSHSAAKVMMAERTDADEELITLQGTLNDMNLHSKQAEGAPLPKEVFKLVYDAACRDVGTPQFDNTHRQLVMMLAEDLQDVDSEDIDDDCDDDIAAAQRAIDGFHIYSP